MIDKKLENSIALLIKILKKEKLSTLKVSNKSGSIEISKTVLISNNIQSKTIATNDEPIKESKNIDLVSSEIINSPMVGVVYLSSKPNSPPFIKKGQKIKKGSTICLIEAMKTFNEIKADKEGIVSNILVKNGEAIEFDQALIELK